MTMGPESVARKSAIVAESPRQAAQWVGWHTNGVTVGLQLAGDLVPAAAIGPRAVYEHDSRLRPGLRRRGRRRGDRRRDQDRHDAGQGGEQPAPRRLGGVFWVGDVRCDRR